MATESFSMTKSKWRKRWRTIIRWSLVVLLVLLLINAGISAWSKSALKRAEARAAAAGDSLNFRDYIPPEISYLENASIYLDAVAALHPVFRKEPWPANSTEPGGPTLKAEMHKALGRLNTAWSVPGEEELVLFRAGLDRFNTHFQLFDRVRHLEKARFDTHYSSNLPIANEVPRITPRLDLAKLLSARALLAMHEGRPEDAYRDAAGIFRLAGWISTEAPALFTKVFAFYTVQIGFWTTNQLMLGSPPGPESMTEILEETGRFAPATMFRRGLLFERAANYATLVDPDFDFSPYQPYNRLSAAHYLDGMSLAMKEAEPPAYQRDPSLQNDDVQVERYAPGFLGMAASMMMDNCQYVAHKRDEMVVHLDLLALAFRLEDHHAAHGEYPERLDLLGGSLPIDPFSGEPYRYRPVDGGYRLYSISGNRVDDGGTPAQKPWQTWRSGDIVWRVR